MSTLWRLFKQGLVTVMPWPLRRRALQFLFGYEIHPSARIGLAWVFPGKLVMRADSRIDHFTVAVNLDRVELGEHSTIGRGNWITGFATGTDSLHFRHQKDRRSELIIGAHSAVTKNHHLDCTSSVAIGDFVTLAGYGSQLLTHSIDLVGNRQDSHPIRIGNHCFVGTDVVILGGAVLPPRSVLGAKSLLNKNFTDAGSLYAGVPAKLVQALPPDALYFKRDQGFVC